MTWTLSHDPKRVYPSEGYALNTAQRRIERGLSDILEVLEAGKPRFRVERAQRSVITFPIGGQK